MRQNILDQSSDLSARQFSIFRIALGAYLLVHFVHLLPYAGELFGNSGILGDPGLNLLPQILPNPLWWSHAPAWLPTVIVSAGAVAATGILLGTWRRVCCAAAWLVWAWLFGRNNLIANPGLPYVGLLLLLGTVIPENDAWALRRKTLATQPWQFPAWATRCVWFLLAAGYTFSGIAKLGSPSWIDGSALRDVLNNPLARPGIFREAFLALPESITNLATWSTLVLEIGFLPLCCFARVRPWLWSAMVMMHLGIILLIDFADLSLGMLLAHLFVFDRGWLKLVLPMRISSRLHLPSRSVAAPAAADQAVQVFCSLTFPAASAAGALNPIVGQCLQIQRSRHAFPADCLPRWLRSETASLDAVDRFGEFLSSRFVEPAFRVDLAQ